MQFNELVLLRILGAFFQFGEDQLGDFPQRFKYAFAAYGDGFGNGFALELQSTSQFLARGRVGQVALVQLQDVGDIDW